MNNNTGRKLKDGTEIMLGDKLKGSQSAEVVVLWDAENEQYGVQVITHPDFWFTLERFLFSWGGSVTKTGSVLQRPRQ